jgi:hypothetical protein
MEYGNSTVFAIMMCLIELVSGFISRFGNFTIEWGGEVAIGYFIDLNTFLV